MSFRSQTMALTRITVDRYNYYYNIINVYLCRGFNNNYLISNNINNIVFDIDQMLIVQIVLGAK